jgi:AraC family transcriptional regulator
MFSGLDYAAFHPSAEVQSQSFHKAGGRCLAIELGAEFTGRVAEYLPLLESRGGFVRGYPASLALAVYNEFCNEDEISLLAIEACVLELTVAAVRYCRTLDVPCPPTWLGSVEELLRQRFMERLMLHDISAVVGVHPVVVARSFRKFRGMTIADFVRRQRIYFAWRQLAKSSLPLSQIALEAGFCDQSHFSRVFKRLTGVPPSQFQSRMR